MQTEYFRAFVALAHTLHFARTASQLGIGQATLSQRIAVLEAKIGGELFSRAQRRVSLTPAGECLLKEIEPVLDQLDAALRNTANIAQGTIGELRVGATSAALVNLLPQTLEKMSQLHPAIRVQIQEHSSMTQERLLLSGEIDVGVLHTPIVAQDLRFELIDQTPMDVALWADHPLAKCAAIEIDTLSDSRVLLPFAKSAPHLIGRIHAVLSQASCDVLFDEHHCAPNALLPMVAARRGIAFVPGHTKQMKFPGVTFVSIKGAPLRLGLATAWRVGERRAAVRHFARVAAMVAEASALPH
jgi:DNA-binding transcriptional LysR family regulator